MGQVQQRVAAEVAAQAAGTEEAPSPARLIAELRERQQTLKQAAATPEERATVELVALLFQAILTDERVPAALRVYFARLQMPVLRVALAEPDFFSGADHPARRLIDRMGACVMGFEGNADLIGTPLEAEIRRVVQVVEAFPDTGRRVFQAVLNEFEKFLEKYFREHNEATKAGVSLAQQIEQRETLAIQYTIELRKMLSDVPVQEGVRDFLFHIWADVLATTAVRHGAKSSEVKTVREAATDLMWMATAKTTREERADVIRKLPRLLGVVRQGMGAAGLDAKRQEDAIKALNAALTAAFSARSVSMSNDQLEQLKQRLETIEEMMPDDEFELDDSWVLDEANHQHEGWRSWPRAGRCRGRPCWPRRWSSRWAMPSPWTSGAARDGAPGLAGHAQAAVAVREPQGRCVLFQKARWRPSCRRACWCRWRTSPDHGRHPGRPAQDQRRSRPTGALTRPTGPSSKTAAEAAVVVRGASGQWINRSSGATKSSSRISASGSSPRLQNTISTMIFRSSRPRGRCRRPWRGRSPSRASAAAARRPIRES
jgi:uncharacterized coiled-coil protein SlyX